jgi:hypothetical protein
MKRLLSAALLVAGISLAADPARAQAPAAAPAAPAVVAAPAPAPGTFVYRNGYYYYARPGIPATYAGQPYTSPGTGTRADSMRGYYSHNGVLRGPSGAMSGRVRHDFDPTGRGVQLYKPWLQPLR